MKNILAMVALLVTLVGAPFAATAQDGVEGIENRRLFVNLTTDDTWSAAKAIMFAHRRSLANGHDTAIWLNVRAVYLAEADRASDIPGVFAEQGTTIHDMLTAFIADGGTVIICQACSGVAGLGAEDYIDGVVMGGWPLVESWLFDPNTQTVSW